MNPRARMGGSMPSGLHGALGAQLLGGTPPEINRNACAVMLSAHVNFADGDSMAMNPVPVGSETGDVEEVLASLDREVAQMKEMIRLRFKHRNK